MTPPPPPVKTNDVKPPTNTEFNSGGLTGQDAINAELKYRASEAGKAEMARKKAEKEAKKAEKEAKKAEREAKKERKSMLDSMGVAFPSPFTPAPKTPQSKSTELIVRPEPQTLAQSMLEFVAGGGTPKQTHRKSEYDKQQEIKIAKMKELMGGKKQSTKDKIQLSDIKPELTGTPNPNKDIASLAIQKAVRGHRARKQIADEANKLEKQIKGVEKTVRKAKKENT
jgi:hypothetical protein